MKHVLMLCAAGTSTSVFAQKVQEVLTGESEDIKVEENTIANVKAGKATADLLLLTPQVAFELDLVRALCPTKKVETIDFETFANVDAATEAKHIVEVLAD